MVKRDRGWSIWKIALAAAGCAAVSAALFWLSVIAAPPTTEAGDEEDVALLTVPTFLQMMGTALAMLAALAVGWLVYRVRQSRIPVWERKKPRKRRRRR